MNEEELFVAVLEKKTPDERRALLDKVCAGNKPLRSSVESLLAAHADAGSFLGHPPVGAEATIATEPRARDTAAAGSWVTRLPFLAPCDKPDRLGKLVGKVGEYEILEVVGYGGMGAVLRALETKLHRVVAVKVMSPDLAANPTAVKRFLREATTAASVHHDHVVTIHAVDDAHQPPYLVMQFVEGQTLQQKIDREGALGLKQILRIGSQAAAGLAAAHKLGLIHRDIKPANILLENGVERVKITDFGLARAADDLQVTQNGIIAGTPQYMSPEQAKGDAIDVRSDLFSLGSVLYTMCTGRPAFRADSMVAVLRRVCDDTPRPIREVNPELPEWLEAIINKLLAKTPAERFQSAAEVADLLSQCLAHVQNPSVVSLPARPDGRTWSSKAPRAALSPRWRRVAVATAAAVVLALTTLTMSDAAGVTSVAATVIRVFTGEGTLVIEADDPSVKVAINGEDVTIQGTGVEEIRLRPGSYKLAASKDGKPAAVDQELVTITRGGKQIVRVKVEEAASAGGGGSRAVWTPPTNPDPQKILNEVQPDIRAGRYEIALAKLVWFHQEALKYRPALSGVRRSFAMSYWKSLADVYTPALEKFKALRDEALASIKAGRNVWESFADLKAINEKLDEEQLTKDTFLWLHEQKPGEARRAFILAEPILIRAKDYALCGQYLDDPSTILERAVSLFRLNKRIVEGGKAGNELVRHAEKTFANKTATLVALLVVNGRADEAKKIAHDAKQEWNDPAFHAALDKALEGNIPEPWPRASASPARASSPEAPVGR